MTDKMQTSGQADMQAAMENMTLNGFQMRLEDQSIVERGLKLAGKFRGAEPEQVKKELKVALAFAPMMASGLEGEMLGMDPKEPISMTELADYKNSKLTKSDLGFSAKAE